jgi:hypothetical protein
MMRQICFKEFCIGILLIASISRLNAQYSKNNLKFYGDFRFRTELDRNSKKMDGSFREDRDRFRYRLRAGFQYDLNENILFGGRIRSGNPKNQQSPHVTIGKEFHSDEFSIDLAYLKIISNNGYWASLGKQNMSLWRQNGFLWNNDVNPEGISIGKSYTLSENSSLAPVFGYFIAGNSGGKFIEDSSVIIGQLKLDSKIINTNIVLASGIIRGLKLPNTPDGTGTYFQDYSIWSSNFQIKLNCFLIGVDYFKNLENYNSNNNINAVFKNQKTGYIGSVKYSFNKFQFGYYYAHIEKYAVVDYFAQDDWLRWGNLNMTRSSNFKGHELSVKYNLNSKFNMVFRAFLVEGIRTTGVSLETGTRVRLDLNIKI